MAESVTAAAQKWMADTNGNMVANDADVPFETALVTNGWPVVNDPIQAIVSDRRYGLNVVRVVLESGISINIPV